MDNVRDTPLDSLASYRSRRSGTMAADATAALRESIVMGSIPPGQPLRLEEIAHQLGMSISPVREAVRQLETLGLAEHTPYKGARVTSLTAGDMFDVYDARFALETQAVRRLAPRFDEEAERRLSRALGLLEEAYASGDRGRAVRGNSFFHLALAEASGSRWIPRLLRPTLQTFERYGAAALTDETAAGVYAIESVGHVEILEACRAGDPEAAVAALARHRDTFVQIFETELAFGDHG